MLDEVYMSYALKLAKKGQFTTHPNPNVGCVIVKNNIIIGKGYHYRAGEAHAEVHALRMAGKQAHGSTVYVNLEPCSYYGSTPACCKALIEAGVARVVVAIKDPNPKISGRGLIALQQAGIKVNCGIMKNEAEQINKGFLKRMRTGFPYVQIKLGASLDGHIAMASGESKWITSEQSRHDVQYLRAKSHAILTSYATIRADNPALTVRWKKLNKEIQTCYPEINLRQPLRIIIDSKNHITPQYKIIKQPGETWIAHIKNKGTKNVTWSWPENVRHIVISEEKNGHLNLKNLMLYLGTQRINDILVEAGGTLSGALIQDDLVDEIIIYFAPKLLGNNTRDLFILPKLKKLSDALQFSFNTIRSVGPDLCVNLTAVKN